MKRFTLLFLLCLLLLTAGSALADSPITVYVMDGHGPVGGASVVALVSGVSVTGTTGPDGLARLTLPNGNYSFTAAKEGYASSTVFARVGVDGNITITLDRLYGVSGTVVDSSTGLPLKDAGVTITDKVTQKYYTGTTDGNGVFTVQVPNGYYSVTVRAAEHKLAIRDNNGAGYHVLDNSLYVGYIPVPGLSGDSGNAEGVSLSCDFPGKTVRANETVAFDVKITNNGAVGKTYSLTVKEAPPGWDVNFYTGTDLINRVFVESKGTKTFQVKATPTLSGSSAVTILASSGADNSSLQLFVDAGKGGDYKLEFSCPDNRTLDAGASMNVEVTVRNNGSAKLTNVGLDIGQDDIPQALTVDAPNRIKELAPGETHRFNLKIAARPDAQAETSKLYLSAVSNEAKTDKKPITVTITKSNTWIGAGIAVALLAILAFGIIVWKYGRR